MFFLIPFSNGFVLLELGIVRGGLFIIITSNTVGGYPNFPSNGRRSFLHSHISSYS